MCHMNLWPPKLLFGQRLQMASTPASNEATNILSNPTEMETNIPRDEVHSAEGISTVNINTDVTIESSVVVEIDKEPENPIENRRRKKTSTVWTEFREVVLPGGQKKAECIHCKKQLALGSTGSTTQYKRHLDRCVTKIRTSKSQNILHFQAKEGLSNTDNNEASASLTNYRYDNSKVREMIAHYILINEKPFSIVEEFGFNLVLKSMSPLFCKYSRITARADVLLVYEQEKKKLKNALSTIRRISFTTDLWKSKNQRVSYMAVTAHYVDAAWRLQKRVLSFSHIAPPHTASEIVDTFYKSLNDWGLENKVFTISVDNASNNDRAIKLLKDGFHVRKKLFFGGRLFHVRCCAHILNLMVKDGIKSIENVVEKVRDSVSFINASEARLVKFTDIVQQLQLPAKKLIMDCPTRWNSTFMMLIVALQLKEAFFSYSDREVTYYNCPSDDEWTNIEKVCDVLGFFNEATNIISGTEYPTSNLFLSQICTIKNVLDNGAQSSDGFINDMSRKMKAKFDKYWGECNLLMSFGAVLDPRMKFVIIDFAFPKIYNEEESSRNVAYVRALLYELYEEYVCATEVDAESSSTTPIVDSATTSTNLVVAGGKKYNSWHDFKAYVSEKANKRPVKSDLDIYLEDGLEICPDGQSFDVIGWWKNNQTKYRTLSKMAVDILAIPISTVASESTFSAGERVVDTYRSKLSVETVQALICGSSWIRAHYGLRGRIKEDDDDDAIEIPLPLN